MTVRHFLTTTALLLLTTTAAPAFAESPPREGARQPDQIVRQGVDHLLRRKTAARYNAAPDDGLIELEG